LGGIVGEGNVPPGNLLIPTLTAGVLRLLPEHLDLFTACDGGAGVGGVFGGAVAMLAGEDIAKGGIVGAAIGLVLGAVPVLLQASGVHS
jgi:hypothetical protein